MKPKLKRVLVSKKKIEPKKDWEEKTFEDEYLGIKFDASSIINICTANSLDNMTKALESRMTIFEIQKLSVEENRILIQKMYQKTISNYNIFEPNLSEDIIESMELFTPREIVTAINNIMAKNTATIKT